MLLDVSPSHWNMELEVVSAEDFEHPQELVADILDEMTHVLGHNPDVTSLLVEHARIAHGGKNGNKSSTPDKVRPFVGQRMPVHLP